MAKKKSKKAGRASMFWMKLLNQNAISSNISKDEDAM